MNNNYELNSVEPKDVAAIESHLLLEILSTLYNPHIQNCNILFRYLMLPINKNLSIDELLSKDPTVVE